MITLTRVMLLLALMLFGMIIAAPAHACYFGACDGGNSGGRFHGYGSGLAPLSLAPGQLRPAYSHPPQRPINISPKRDAEAKRKTR
jgi:hypothetical protein